MEKNNPEAEKNFIVGLGTSVRNKWPDEVPTREQVKELAQILSSITNYHGDIDEAVNKALYNIDTKMAVGVSLVDPETDHDEEWVKELNDDSWQYSAAYERHLLINEWAPGVVNTISEDTLNILGHLRNPKDDDSHWDHRGLVIGHVQSGKTANYLGLITRAADAGYRFILVLAGVHENLRKQTQERVDEGFTGRTVTKDGGFEVGVALENAGFPKPACLTNTISDFKKATAAQNWRLADHNKPIVLVIKKNVRTLESLYTWLKGLNANNAGTISDLPMLMIDDEADNASINTKKEDVDPTKTNRWIREILGLFDKRCYVGYTATPYANILINPDAYGDEKLRKELFPKDFIYCLDAPTTYFGPRKVFLDDHDGRQANENQVSPRVLQQIYDAENIIPLKHDKYIDLVGLPPSLENAIRQFVISKAIRIKRGQANKHCSMLINVSRFVDVQKRVKSHVSLYLKRLREAIKANYAMPDGVSDNNLYMQSLRKVFEEDYSDCGLTWNAVINELFGAVDSVKLFVVNSDKKKSDEVLDYKRYEKTGSGLTAIAIGGLSLSRGLTIEGLCISYMYRNTRMYDTLMQMGRWFGYRFGFADLCRIHLPQDSIDWYSHIAGSTENLRQQITEMRADNLSPLQFGLYVQSHEEGLMVTAANKMRNGEKITLNQNYSGDLKESYLLPFDEKINDSNRMLVQEYWDSKFGAGALEPTKKGWFIKDASTFRVIDFLRKFRVYESFISKLWTISYLEKIASKHEFSDVLFISNNNEIPSESAILGAQVRDSGVKNLDGCWRLSKYRVASRGDEKLGLKDVQLKAAKDSVKPSEVLSDHHFRRQRNKPLLMIHLINVRGEDGSGQDFVPAYGISFPYGDYSKGVEVVANKVWLAQFYGEVDDLPDDEEDYDV